MNGLMNVPGLRGILQARALNEQSAQNEQGLQMGQLQQMGALQQIMQGPLRAKLLEAQVAEHQQAPELKRIALANSREATLSRLKQSADQFDEKMNWGFGTWPVHPASAPAARVASCRLFWP